MGINVKRASIGVVTLVVFGAVATNVTTAQGAPSAVSAREFKQLQLQVLSLQNQLKTYDTSRSSVLIPEGYSDLLGEECGRAGVYEREFEIEGKRFFQCRFRFVVGK